MDKELNQWDLILLSDLVCGMSSMFLIEAALLQKNILSIQIGLKQENPFILSRMNVIPSILTEDDLIDNLLNLVFNKSELKYNFDVIKNPVQNIINEMERCLWVT